MPSSLPAKNPSASNRCPPNKSGIFPSMLDVGGWMFSPLGLTLQI